MHTDQRSYFIGVGDRLSDGLNVDLEVDQVKGGGFGVVAIGRDVQANGAVSVLKTQNPEIFARIPRAKQEFIQEALTWIGLWPHPNVLEAEHILTLNIPPYGEVPFIKIEYANGGSLRDHLVNRGIPIAQAILWAQHIAAGLVALHDADDMLWRYGPIVHRDLKPENILICGEYLKITDLGLARVLDLQGADPSDTDRHGTNGAAPKSPVTTSADRATSIAGTPGYIAPEHRQGLKAQPSADIYALGVILEELRAATDQAAPDDLVQLAHKCRSFDPQQRPTARTALRALQLLAEALGTTVYQPKVVQRTDQLLGEFWRVWGLAFASVGMLEEAVKRERRSVALDSSNGLAWAALASYLRQQAQWARVKDETSSQLLFQEALEAAEQATTYSPTSVSAWNSKGTILGALGRNRAALDALHHALDIQPSAKTWHNLGSVLGREFHFQEALEAFDHALELDSNDADTWMAKGSVLILVGRLSEAFIAYERASERNISHPLVSHGVDLIRERTEQLRTELRDIHQLMESDPVNADLWYRRGVINYLLGDCQHAVEAYERALAIDSNRAVVWRRLAIVLNRLGRPAAAQHAYEVSLRLDPKNPAAWFNLAMILRGSGHGESALHAYDRALALDPSYAPAWAGKGLAHGMLGQFSTAIVAFDRAIEFDEEEALAWEGKAQALVALRRYAEALDACERWVALRAENARSWLTKGMLLILLGRKREALKSLTHGTSLGGEGDLSQEFTRLINIASSMAGSER